MTSWLRHSDRTGPDRQVGILVREYRLASGLNQAAVAEALGITQQFLSQVETGVRKVTLDQRHGFMRVLGIPAEELGLAGRSRHGSALHETSAAVASSRGRWRVQRHWLNRHRAELGDLAAQWHALENRVPRTTLIAGDGWLADRPLELQSLRLRLDERPQAVQTTGAEPETLSVRPLRIPSTPFETYSSAVKHLDPPQLFESRPSYRYLGGSMSSRAMNFGLATYFDKLDVSEALAHELAAATMNHTEPTTAELRGKLPFRELVGDPFDTAGRAIVPAVTTLTLRLRRYPADPTFLLHWRDPARVATAAGVYDVIPAGEFQPSGVALWDRNNDFSLWRNIVREFSEELLGQPEHDGSRSSPIDYPRWPLYEQLSDARRRGRLSAFVLGLGAGRPHLGCDDLDGGRHRR
ncbi:helix-turn-helix domain-containing protein [Nocardia jinanensis]|uniref:HTH cro/C1-type domain-containing protein n=1 Tax=Nocardia jinanensis TaxID=382504 RepID=A0A917RSS9_9NOCA|nr:helix-turn-helix transcriptional regulator [Nocardia jinanensis]GGL24987.1 hypothetical protein GCM10011588_44790 [Nocardia jinanensis]